MAQEANVALVHSCSADIPLVRGDPVKLRQIFTNLISNAIKFTKEGGTVSVEAMRAHDGGFAVIVSDTGIGMSEDELMIAMTPFGQVDGSRTRWREGTGLGLPIAKSLVELHGGLISIRSVKGQGTEVTVALPPPHQVTVAEGRDAVLGQGLAL